MTEQRFHVMWEIDLYAETPQEAAEQAWELMRALDSTACVFEVFDEGGCGTQVDLMEEES